ncbi:Glycosyltransferase involved in cell wall bisynthesis [Parapedobacter composti]|uniref:Glycosyltransferase involved in cell wall bisynthesis n=1 Tax=Parapedobacter composti TaxID=623281 RepID=A0A1I1ISZ3_9SPHI|nr:glycosyltransferase [Parapedobacter composti]SFC38852.1 Glycosyltransferase involved in cell wall bisynthesis [Parapedobacter composti]
MKEPLVSICCITYNHEEFIRQCLESFVMQRTTFPFEILIYDDASSDNTAQIIDEYQQMYPAIIKPIIQKENQYSKGVRGMNLKYNFPRAKGKYIALCEGDDYWTDPLKLQKQVDFLETHDNFVLCAHKHDKLIDGKLIKNHKRYKEVLSIYDLAKQIDFITLSVVFRRAIINNEESKIALNGQFTNFLFVYIAQFGLVKQFNVSMGVYRVHRGGIWSGEELVKRMEMSLYGINSMIEYIKMPKVRKILIQKFIRKCLGFTLQLLKRRHKGFLKMFKTSFAYGWNIMHLKFPLLYIKHKIGF